MRLPHLIFTMLLGSFSANADQGEKPQILNFYPDCEYRVIEEINRRNAIPMKNRSVSPEEKQAARHKLIESIRHVARDHSADAIILTGSRAILEQEQFSSNKTKIKLKSSMRAELLDLEGCDTWQGKRPAPFDKTGVKQRLQSAKVRLQHSVSFVVDNGKARDKPVVDSDKVAINSGIYGVALGSDIEEVVAVFGTPMLEYQLDADTVLLGFGRSLWLVFRDNELISAGSINRWFSRDLINFIPFDPRFDNRDWRVEGEVTKGMPVADALRITGASHLKDKEQLLLRDDNAELVMSYTGYIEDESRVVKQIRAFELRRPDIGVYSLDETLLDDGVSERVSGYLHDDNADSLTTNTLLSIPLGSIWLDKLTKMLIYNSNMTAEAKGENITKVHFVENVFDHEYFVPGKPWTFAGTTQGQSLKFIAEQLGERVFAYDDQLQVNGDKYVKNLYFDNKSGEYLLYAAEISVY